MDLFVVNIFDYCNEAVDCGTDVFKTYEEAVNEIKKIYEEYRADFFLPDGCEPAKKTLEVEEDDYGTSYISVFAYAFVPAGYLDGNPKYKKFLLATLEHKKI